MIRLIFFISICLLPVVLSGNNFSFAYNGITNNNKSISLKDILDGPKNNIFPSSLLSSVKDGLFQQPSIDYLQQNSDYNNTLLTGSDIKNIEDFKRIDLLQKEIKEANDNLYIMASKIDALEKENKQLKYKIQQYIDKDKINNAYNKALKLLSNDAKKMQDKVTKSIPKEYLHAYQFLISGDINSAEYNFKKFQNMYRYYNKNKNLVKEYLDKYILYSNYWLGRINTINLKYNDAIKYFSQSYKNLKNDNIYSLLSLVGIVEDLTKLYETGLACSTINQFYKDYNQVDNTKVSLIKRYLTDINNYKAINKCQ